MVNNRDIHFDTLIGHHLRSNSVFSKFSRCLPFSKWLPKHGIKKSAVKFDMWVDNDVPNWFPTLKNFYRSPFSKWPPPYAQIQHCQISTTFHMWVDYNVSNLFPTLKNFYRSPFSKLPPQYHKNSISKVAFDLFTDILSAVGLLSTGNRKHIKKCCFMLYTTVFIFI